MRTPPALLALLLTACSSSPEKADPEATSADDSAEEPTPSSTVDADEDGITEDHDCDDDDPAVGLPSLWFPDGDADGFVDPSAPTEACTAPPDHVAAGPTDCDDTDPAVTAPGAWYVDADGDGHGDARYAFEACEAPSGTSSLSDDCDDGDPTAHPAAEETCDGVDNDCDTEIDEGTSPRTVYYDSDGDGYGDAGFAVETCAGLSGFVENSEDCDDSNSDIHPEGEEVCDRLDNNCSGIVDDAEECAPPPGEWWETAIATITDAEFDRVNELIIAINGPDWEAHIIDPTFGTVQTISLAAEPLQVSVDLAGGEAAISHDGAVTWVDLLTGTIIDVVSSSTDPGDIVLVDGFAYTIPILGQWVDVYSLDLVTGTESSSYGSRNGTRIKAHPDHDRFYGADRGLSPSDFERYDIDATTSVATLTDDSPYHGDHSISGDIWISDDGGTMFMRAATAFSSTSSLSTDMTYSGSLDSIGQITWVDTASATDRVYAVREGLSQVWVYDLGLLSLQGSPALPEQTIGGTDHPLSPLWVFASSDGAWLHVLGELPSTATSAASPWSFVTLDASTLP